MLKRPDIEQASRRRCAQGAIFRAVLQDSVLQTLQLVMLHRERRHGQALRRGHPGVQGAQQRYVHTNDVSLSGLLSGEKGADAVGTAAAMRAVRLGGEIARNIIHQGAAHVWGAGGGPSS